MEAEKKMKLLGELYDDWHSCRRCGLCEPEVRIRNNVVFGEGNPDAHLVVVGEAPGDREDVTGHPFSGRSGEVIDMMLDSFASSRDEVFLLNIVGCRPTEIESEDGRTRIVNRKPSKEEIAACAPRVSRILEIIDPYVVLMLGATAMKALTDEKGLTKLAKSPMIPQVEVQTPGQFVPIPRPGFVTYHPAFLLRNWSMEEGSDVHRSFLTWKKAFQVADSYAELYKGVTPPLREKQNVE